MAVDARFLTEGGREVFTGNELLVKGALETPGGVHLMTGYPGSPVAGFFDTLGEIADLLTEKGIRAFQANNEALGAAAVNGSQMVACRALCAMKSVGVHVASDALALGTLAGAHPEGGAVVIMGDDPWCESTQVPADSRFICEHLRMAVVEPGTPQELKDWIGSSFALSQAGGLYIGFITTVAHADGGGTVLCRPNQYPALNSHQKMALDTSRIDLNKVLLPPRTWQRELRIGERFAITMETARALKINRIEPATRPFTASGERCPLGFIVTGIAGPYVRHVLYELGLADVFPILNMGLSYPADVRLVAEFSKLCQNIVVVEERRSFLEKNIRDSLFHELPHGQASDLAGRLFGKRFPGPRGADGATSVEGFPDNRGLNYSVVAQKLIPLIQSCERVPAEMRNGRLTGELDILRRTSKPRLNVFNDAVVSRTPTFCPGCPHRDSSAALLELRKNLADPAYMRTHHDSGPVDLVAHGDTGCYTMLMFAPTEQLMHNYSGMGLGGGTGSGIDPFITNKQLVFMGDGTFFHSGQVAISNSIKAGQDLTYIILENGTTAMTGHQEHAGTAVDLLGHRSPVQDIEQIVRAMAGNGGLLIYKLSPADRTQYRKALEEAILSPGVKVVIADKECGITYHRSQFRQERKEIQKHGYLPKKTHMNVTPDVCENCLECTKATACPGLTTIDTDYGRKIDTDLTWCVNDGACERVKVSNEAANDVKPCPSFEQVTVIRTRRRRYTLPQMGLDKLPDPQRVHDLSAPAATWRVHMSGVGGMGIGLVGSILVRAGHREGYRVVFQDKKGLAIRNGGVFAQITFVSSAAGSASETADATPAPDADVITGSIPYGRADLLLGIDILEAARAVDPREPFRIASPKFTSAVLNLHKQPTVLTLLGRSDFDPDALRELIIQACNPEHSYAKNLAEICEQRLGSKQFVNIMMLGIAYQLGLIPVSARSIGWAIKEGIRRDHRRNVKAFNIGRKLALEPRALPLKPEPVTWEQLINNKTRILRRSRWRGAAQAARFESQVRDAVARMPALPEQAKYDLALRIYDLTQYESAGLARRYANDVARLYDKDSADREYAATVAAIWGLARVTLIKDEPYVAYLLTRYEKKQRDMIKYGVDPSNGDHLVYRHHTNPEFNIGPWRLRFKITTTDWQLRLVRKMKWWRRLPGWHHRECEFRDWYFRLLDRISLEDENSYRQAVRVLKCPEDVTGYREIRYPKMARAQEMVEADLRARHEATFPLTPSRSLAVLHDRPQTPPV
jgi:indolepyruvate ferredoxin oxidoreductase